VKALVALAAGVTVGVLGLPGALAGAAADVASCSIKPGVPAGSAIPWAQNRLNFQRVWPVTTGAGVLVAVIDTGLDKSHPQLRGVATRPGTDVVSSKPSASTVDCDGHGTMVTSIIAAQHVNGESFVGVAPGATILAIKQTDSSQQGGGGDADGIGRGIEAAIKAHAEVANLSVFVQAASPLLDKAVADAANAGLVIVAAAGNFAQNGNPATYPAAYSTKYPNIIAVGATDTQDVIGPFSEFGNYVDITAPGVGVETPSALSGYAKNDGTSFAAPYVTGTVALMLAANHGMSAAEVRNRLEATADPPPASVPDARYGYGIVNPYLAVTSIRDDAPAPASTSPPRPLPARAAAPPADRHLQHVALAAALVLLGLAVLAVVGAAVLRGQRRAYGQRAG
jgi:membrane-anchored mycosin MYCP